MFSSTPILCACIFLPFLILVTSGVSIVLLFRECKIIQHSKDFIGLDACSHHIAGSLLSVKLYCDPEINPLLRHSNCCPFYIVPSAILEAIRVICSPKPLKTVWVTSKKGELRTRSEITSLTSRQIGRGHDEEMKTVNFQDGGLLPYLLT